MNKQECTMYFNNFEEYCNLFGEDAMLSALKSHNYKNFTTTQSVKPGNNAYYDKLGYYKSDLKQCFFTDHEFIKGRDYEAHYTAPGYEMTVPCQYQGYKHGSIIKSILIDMFPYLSKYSFDCYALSGKANDYEIYLKTKDEGHIYIPIAALKTKDINIIINRMQSYWKWYYRDKPEQFNKHCTIPLNSPTFEQLKIDILEVQ